MTVNIKIKTGNAAFDGDDKGYEIGRILRSLATDIENGSTDINIRDVNGHNVGTCKVTKR